MGDFDADTKAFADWIDERFNFVSKKFVITDLREKEEGRGLIATEDIAKGEILFELYRESILNIDTASFTKLRPENRDILLSLNQWQALIICVSYEWYLGKASEYLPYLSVLPLTTQDFHSLMLWSDEELKLLKPSTVIHRIGRSSAEEMYAMLVADIIPEKLAFPELAEFLTEERFHIVASLIMSYSFDVDHPEEVELIGKALEATEKQGERETNGEIEKELDEAELEKRLAELGEEDSDDDERAEALEESVGNDTCYKSMVPLADTLNSNTTLYNATLKYEKTKLVMMAEKDIKKGEQIFNIYGELPNSEILRKYGYVELPSSRFEFTEVTLDSVISFFEFKFAKHIEYLKEAQVVKLIEVIIDTIKESEYLLETMAEELEDDIVSDRYEIYANGEVLPELLLIILIMTSLYQAAESDKKWFKTITRSIERKASSDLLGMIDRTILKCHQLLENKSILTRSALDNLKEIMNRRIGEYPTHIIDGSYNLPESYSLTVKKELADIVLFNEVKCLKDVIEGKFPPIKEDGSPRFKIIEDEKFMKNVLKRKLEDDDAKAKKKKK